MLQELTGLSSTAQLKVKNWRKSNFSIGKLLLKSVNVFIQFHSYTALLHNYLSIIKCEMFRNIAHSDIYMKLHSFGVWTTKHSNSRNISGIIGNIHYKEIQMTIQKRFGSQIGRGNLGRNILISRKYTYIFSFKLMIWMDSS